MSHGASPYPISQLLVRLIEESGGTIPGFVQSLGYRNIERGTRRLRLWLDTGMGFERIIKQVVSAYPAVAEELAAAIKATESIRAAEAQSAFYERCKAEEATFRAYIHVQGETTIPRQITLFAITGGKTNLITIPPYVLHLPTEEQLAVLPELMRAYLVRYNGQCPFFGAVTGFRFVRLLDYYQFDKDGLFVGYVAKPFRRGTASVTVE